MGAVRLGPFFPTSLTRSEEAWLTAGVDPGLLPCPGNGRGQPGECAGQPGTERQGLKWAWSPFGGQISSPAVPAVQMRPLTFSGNNDGLACQPAPLQDTELSGPWYQVAGRSVGSAALCDGILGRGPHPADLRERQSAFVRKTEQLSAVVFL